MTRLLSKVRRRRRPAPRPILAWCVHAYTALGLVAAAVMAILIVDGSANSFRWAFVLMLAATLIDATDGTLARRVRVKEVLPSFDGRRLDDLIDFLNYTFLPLLLIWRAGLLPRGHEAWLLVPLVASAYGFSQSSAKTADGFFLGFPSYWNVIAFYLYLLHPPGWLSLFLILFFAVLTFVPSRYLYPSQRGGLNRLTNILAALWVGLVVWILFLMPGNEVSHSEDPTPTWLAYASLFFPVYYLVASWSISFLVGTRIRRGQSDAARPEATG
jgi:phosphatidylcholine synthase